MPFQKKNKTNIEEKTEHTSKLYPVKPFIEEEFKIGPIELFNETDRVFNIEDRVVIFSGPLADLCNGYNLIGTIKQLGVPTEESSYGALIELDCSICNIYEDGEPRQKVNVSLDHIMKLSNLKIL